MQTLADRVNASNQHLSHLDTGKRRLTVDWIEWLATAMACGPLELLSANVAEVTEQELTLLKIFRSLNSHQQQPFIAAAAALADPRSCS